jgi:GNAT superfamily N-acetyltransferase
MPILSSVSSLPAVEALQTVTEQDMADFVRLVAQLTNRDMPEPDVRAAVRRAVNPDNPDSRVVVVRDEQGHIQAMATGTICRIPSGEKAWIDDVVTDAEHRGRGYAKALMVDLHGWLVSRGVRSVNLTSTPQREAAGNLYEAAGYQVRDTRVFRSYL